MPKRTTKHVQYLPEEEEKIYATIMEARENDLDIGVVMQNLADEMGRSRASIEWKFYEVKKKKEGKAAFPKKKMKKVEEVNSNSLISDIKVLIKKAQERDKFEEEAKYWKKEYEKLLYERKQIAKLIQEIKEEEENENTLLL
jgi:hypothetical protein